MSALLASFYPIYHHFLDSNTNFYIIIFWVITLLILLKFGNREIIRHLDERLPWNKYHTKRLTVQVVLSLSYSAICINLTYIFIYVGLAGYVPSFDLLTAINFIGLILFFIVMMTYYALHFLKEWRITDAHHKKLLQQQSQKQAETLQNYIDPVFLLGNAKKLAELQDIHPKKATFFLKKWTDLHDYIVQNRCQKLVSLRQELDFVDSYFHILKMRFGNAFVLDVRLSESLLKEKCLPPLVIQLLIENAMNHNNFEETMPLHIEIFSTHDQFVLVRNNIQRRPQTRDSSRSILSGIHNKYIQISHRQVINEVSDVYFTVHLPLLSLKDGKV